METEEIQRLGEKIIYQYIKHCENKKMEDKSRNLVSEAKKYIGK